MHRRPPRPDVIYLRGPDNRSIKVPGPTWDLLDDETRLSLLEAAGLAQFYEPSSAPAPEIEPPPSRDERVLTVLTYNVKRDNEPRDWTNIVQLLLRLQPDVIALQEVAPPIYRMTQDALGRDYDMVISPTRHDAEMLLARKDLGAHMYEPLLLPDTGDQKRHLLTLQLHLPGGLRLVVGTLHAQSVFFERRHTDTKCRQIGASVRELESFHPHCLLLVGDMNLTSGHELGAENRCIDALGLEDVWKSLHDTTEDEHDRAYRRDDVTWDGANNPKVRGHEFHRPDRVFLKCLDDGGGGGLAMIPLEIERIVNTFSDHYGLVARFSY